MYGWKEALHVLRVYASCTNAEQRKEVREWYFRIRKNFGRDKRLLIISSLT